MFPTDYWESAKRIVATLGVLLVLSVVISTGMYVHYLKGKVDKLEERATTSESNHKAAEAWRKGHIDLVRERKEVDTNVEQVLEDAPEWSDEPVPSAVADLLRERTSTER
jgi:Tfp pilus assembly protein PilO